MSSILPNITQACFGLSYLLAFALELVRVLRPGPGLRYAGLGFGLAGLFAHSVFLLVHQPNPARPYGSLLAVAWVLAVFYLYGALHHSRKAWAIFVLPVVLGLLALAFLQHAVSPVEPLAMPSWFLADRVWGAVHGIFLLLAAVGVTVGFLASVMYLIQARRLRNKMNPLGSFKMLNLERLEAMNRRAVNLAFPLLTIGLLLGGILLKQYHGWWENWYSVKVLGTVGLWVVCMVLCYLRYAVSVTARRLATLTILAFAILVMVLVATHPFVEGAR